MKALSDRQAGFVEGFAAALERIFQWETGDHRSGKSYDPMTVNENGVTMHSYAFDMKDGGRHHAVAAYKNVNEIADVLFHETCADIVASRNDE